MPKKKFLSKVKDSFNKRLEKSLKPLIIKQMYVGYKLLLANNVNVSIENYLLNYRSILNDIELGNILDEYNSFYDNVISLEK